MMFFIRKVIFCADAVKILHKKKLVLKDFSSEDSRSYSLHLSELGKETVLKTNDLALPLKNEIDGFEKKDLEIVFKTLTNLIYKLNQTNILKVQRTCYGCKFHHKSGIKDYCNLLEKELLNNDIRLDCPEFVMR